MHALRTVVALAVLSAASQLLLAQTQPGPHHDAAVITVQSPISEVMDGYHNLTIHHPELNKTSSGAPSHSATMPFSNDAAEKPSLEIRMPSIDLYSPAGISLFHGTSVATNASFIRGFQPNIPLKSAQSMTEFRPTLAEALAIFKELAPYAGRILARKHYTIFVMTYPNVPSYKPQDDALEVLMQHAQQMRVQVVEVQLIRKRPEAGQ